MKTWMWKGAAGLALLCGLAACGEDKPGEKAVRVVKLPVTGVQAECCDTAVQDALKKVPAVADVAFEKTGDTKWAVVILKKDTNLELSKVQKALADATEDMGKGMGTEYKLDSAALPVDASVVFHTATLSDEDKARMDKALADVKGFESSAVAPDKDKTSSLTLKFKDKSSGSLEQVTKILKDAKIDVKEVVFLGVK